MNKSKIEWCDMTWNPVTGCLHNCEYCYARKIVKRFGQCKISPKRREVLEKPYIDKIDGDTVIYPYGFIPTLHCYRLEEPQLTKKPQNIFVCSMADLFGEWVPDEWIQAVFEACEKAPQHRYLFLTKNYRRYNELRKKEILPLDENMYFGASVTTEKQLKQAGLFWNNIDFLSIEPLSEYLGFDEWSISEDGQRGWEWVIVGAETGNRKGRVKVKRYWIKDIVDYSYRSKDFHRYDDKSNWIKKYWQDIPVFMKDNLASIWGEPLIQEYPWEEA